MTTFSLLGFLGATAHGQIIFSDDFEGYTLGDTLESTANWERSTNFSTNVEYATVRDESTSTVFGTSNQFMEFVDDATDSGAEFKTVSGETSTLFSDTYNQLTQFSFDFYESSTGGAGDLFIGYTGIDNRLGNTRARAMFSLNDGTIGSVSGSGTTTYSLDTVHRAFLVLNDTTAGISYNGRTIAAESADLWLQQSGFPALVYAGTATTAASTRSTNGYALSFTSFNADTPSILVDNVELAVVPEPSSLILIGLAGLAVWMAHRRRRP